MDITRWIWAYGTAILCVILSIIAFIRGGAPERWGAAVLLISWFVTPLVDNHHGFRTGIFIVDVITLFAFGALSFWSRRLWLVLATAMQLATVATHIAALVAPGILGRPYIIVLGIWGAWGLLLAMLIGILTIPKRPINPEPD